MASLPLYIYIDSEDTNLEETAFSTGVHEGRRALARVSQRPDQTDTRHYLYVGHRNIENRANQNLPAAQHLYKNEREAEDQI